MKNTALKEASYLEKLKRSVIGFIRLLWALGILSAITVAYTSASEAQQRATRESNSRHMSIDLHHETYGKGPPLLMLHGFGASSYTWRHLIESLAATNKVILVDLKGFGESPKPKDHLYAVKDQADLIHSFIIKHDINNVTLVGHSLGGAVALLVSLRLLEEKPSRLLSLVLIDSAGYRQDLPAFLDILRTPLLGPIAFSLLSDTKKVKMILKKAYFDDHKITRDQVRTYSAALDSKGGEHALFETAKKLIPANIDEITKRYNEITVPTLIIWGRHDRIVPLKVGQTLHATIPSSELVIVENCGHIPQEEQPRETLSTIQRFLKTQSKG